MTVISAVAIVIVIKLTIIASTYITPINSKHHISTGAQISQHTFRQISSFIIVFSILNF